MPLCISCRESLPSEAYGVSDTNGKRKRTCNPCLDLNINKPKPSRDDRPRYVRDWFLKQKYGITLSDYNQMVVSRCGACAVCGEPESKIHSRSGEIQPLSVHHDHTTGRVIGLYCQKCNSGSGFFSDNPEFMRRAAALMEEVS